MHKIVTWLLVAVVLLAGAVGPGLAAQNGPPDHANDDEDGPPDHANAGDDEEERSDDERDDDQDEDERNDEDRDGDEGEDRDDAGGVLAAVEDAVGDEDGDDDATPTATARATSTDTDDSETPTNPLEPVTEIFETPEDTPEDTPEPTAPDTPEPTAEETPEATDPPSSEDWDPLPDPRETETPMPTREPTEAPPETREETPEPTTAPSSEGDGDDDDDTDYASSGDGDSGEGSSGSILDSDEDPTATPTPAEPSIEYGGSGDATRASVDDVRAGRTVEVPLRGPATDGEGVAVEAVDVGLESGEPFTLTVTRPTADGGEEPAPGVPVGYFEVETDHGGVGNATLTVSVEESALPAGVAPGDLEVLRYADGEWQSTETTYDEAAGVYTAETTGFSQFALAAPGDGSLQVTDVAIDESGGGDGSGEGEADTVHATVENTADRQATGTVAMTVDGETVGTRELTLGGGETATVSFDLPAEQAADGTVAVDGVESERLQAQETETEPATGSIDGTLAFGVAAAAFLVLSAVGTGLLAARNDEWDLEP